MFAAIMSLAILLTVAAVGVAIGVQIGAKLTANAYKVELDSMFRRHNIS